MNLAGRCSVVLLLALPGAAAAREHPMMRAKLLDGVDLEYEVRGAGEAVVLVHAGVFADWFQPLMNEPALARRYRLVRYHRIGYAGSSHAPGPVSIAQQAEHLRLLLLRLGIQRAHLVGHSSGGNIALQLALDAPEMVRSIALLEPALIAVATAEDGAGPVVGSSLELGPVFERYRAGDKAGAVDAFMRGVAGPDYRAVVDRVLPRAFEQAVADADTFFGQELPAVRAWSFTRERASRIGVPVLAVIGARSEALSPVWGERQKILLGWLPRAEAFVLARANHLLHLENPGGMAEALAGFFSRHEPRGH